MPKVDEAIVSAHAMTLNSLAKKLIKQASDWSVGGDADPPPQAASEGALGFMLLAPFALELAIKALLASQNHGQVPGHHHLLQLFNTLGSNLIVDIEKSFASERQAQYPQHQNQGIMAEIVVTDWNDAFVQWRYLGEQLPAVVSHVREGPLLTDAILQMLSQNYQP